MLSLIMWFNLGYSGLVFKKKILYDLCLNGPWPAIVFFLKGLYTSVGD